MPRPNRLSLPLLTVAALLFASAACAGLIDEAKKTQEKPRIKKLEFPSESQVTMSNSGKVKSVQLSQAFEVQGISWPKDTLLQFDEAGKLSWASFRETVRIEGVDWPGPCSARFAQNGKIYRIYVLENCTIQGKQFTDGNVLKVDSRGQVIKTSDIYK